MRRWDSDFEPYVAAAAERPPAGRLDALRGPLVIVIVVLLVLSVVGVALVNARQDPSLVIPSEVQASPDALQIPDPQAS
ncbi:MAG: hypothetical protein ACR2HR_13010 [Euzebya sp.]